MIDTGLKSAVENIAWDRALVAARREGAIGDTIRFLRFTPSALVGYHQSVGQEIRVDYCKQRGIDINRRVTGGGAIYFDEGQLGWELVFNRDSLAKLDGMEKVSAAICRSAASALKKMGIDAVFRPRNDIEVGGRKISGTGGLFEKETVLFQGTLLVDFNLENLIKALRIPVEKLTDKQLLSARQRVTSIREILGRVPPMDHIKQKLAIELADLFGQKPKHENLSVRELELAEGFIKEVSSEEWIEPRNTSFAGNVELVRTVSKSPGGLLRVAARVDRDKKRIKQALITGDVLVSPARLIYDLEAALKDTRVDEAVLRTRRFFENRRFDSVAVTADDFAAVIEKLVDKVGNYSNGLTTGDLNAVETMGGGLVEVSGKAGLMLLPYCAKPVDCQHRNIDACGECGECTIGDAYALAKKSGLKVRCVSNYQELVSILKQERHAGVESFVGACCGAFFTKRNKAFADSGMSCAIVDIDDTTCYELNEEELAYEGKFNRQTSLKLDLLEKVLSLGSRDRKPVT